MLKLKVTGPPFQDTVFNDIGPALLFMSGAPPTPPNPVLLLPILGWV